MRQVWSISDMTLQRAARWKLCCQSVEVKLFPLLYQGINILTESSALTLGSLKLRLYPLLEGGGATPIKQMSRYLSLGVAGEVRLYPFCVWHPGWFQVQLSGSHGRLDSRIGEPQCLIP